MCSLPDTTTRGDEGVVQGGMSRNTTKSGIIGLPDEVFPIIVGDARLALELDEILDDVEKGVVGVDRKSHWLKFKTLPGKVDPDGLFACAFCKAYSSEDLVG